jgi:hypothetical protein
MNYALDNAFFTLLHFAREEYRGSCVFANHIDFCRPSRLTIKGLARKFALLPVAVSGSRRFDLNRLRAR